jgi:glycosyltransferase involved in cell wall biosynthesis
MTAAPRLLMVQTQAENAGAQEIARRLGEGFAARGCDVRHLFFFRRTDAFDDVPGTIFCGDQRPGNPVAFARFFARLVAETRRARPDVVLTFQHYGNIFGGLAARLAGGYPVIANQVSARATTNGPIRFVDGLLGTLGVFDRITVNSSATEGDFAGYPARYRRRIVHVPHGFALKTSRLAKEEARRQLGVPADGPLLGSVARLHPLKRLDTAVRLLPLRPTWRLALAGQGADEARLRSLAEELGVGARVHFTGERSSDAVGDFLAALDVFAFPSAAETFGLAAVEAAAAGVPVVSADLPVLEEVLRSPPGPAALFVDPEDTAAFADAVDRILGDPGLAAALVAGGRGLSGRYGLDGMVEDYMSIIRELLPVADAVAGVAGQ